MPHLLLEHTTNLAAELDRRRLLDDLHAAMARTGEFKEADIKGRIIAHEHHRAGDGDPKRGFAHLTVSIKSGRSMEFRKQLAADLLAVLRRAFARTWDERPTDLTVDVREMVAETYAKAANERSPG
jgi:5-carboxymethyl-2-hydroxymuconate isomerase